MNRVSSSLHFYLSTFCLSIFYLFFKIICHVSVCDLIFILIPQTEKSFPFPPQSFVERTSPFLIPYLPLPFHIADVSFFTEGSTFSDYIPEMLPLPPPQSTQYLNYKESWTLNPRSYHTLLPPTLRTDSDWKRRAGVQKSVSSYSQNHTGMYLDILWNGKVIQSMIIWISSKIYNPLGAEDREKQGDVNEYFTVLSTVIKII